MSEFEESVVQRLERTATALEKLANTWREDLDFRMKCAAEQAELVQRLTAGGNNVLTKPTPPPGTHLESRRARRG